MHILSVTATWPASVCTFYIRKSKQPCRQPRLAVATPRRRHQLHIMVCLRLLKEKRDYPIILANAPRHYFGFDYIYHWF